VKSSTNQELIDLKVWNDALGNPSAAVKTMSSILPLYSDEVNQLITYWFEEPLAINETTFPSLIFYIGWTQNSLSNLNVGLDRYNDSHTCRFYNVDGTWQMSSPDNYGSLMLRPVIGKINPLGVNPQLAGNHLLLQPNPVSDGNLFITLPETWEKTAGKNVSVKIFTATGSQVSVRQYTNPLNVSDLATGLYIVVVANQLNGTQLTGKLIVR
jgi:hypothetical protein